MPKITTLKGGGSIEVKHAVEEFFEKNNLTVADLNGVDLHEFSRYASIGQKNTSTKGNLVERYNDSMSRVLDPENKQMTSEQKLAFFEMMDTTGIKVDDKVKGLLKAPISERLANYFYDTRNTPITDEAKKIMKEDVIKILKPLDDFSKEAGSIVKNCSAEARVNNNKSSFFSWMKDQIYEMVGYKQKQKHNVIDIAQDIGLGIKDLIAKSNQGSISNATAKSRDKSR